MNWGIIGYGEITPSFIDGLLATKNGKLVGIASVSAFEYLKKEKAYNNVQIFKSYEELVNVTEIDIVYVSTTNNLHFDNAALSIKAGKHILCEKPLTPTFMQTKELINLAKERNVFLMEGMWTRFLPSYRKFIELLNSNFIGKPILLKADFGFFNSWPEYRRLLNPELFGGTLLDNSDYNIFLSQDIFKEYPTEINAQATFANTGVEDACSILLKYANGGMAQLYSSFRCKTKQEAIIYGELGYIELREFWHGTEVVINKGEKAKKYKFSHFANGFEYEVESVEKVIKEGKIENKLIPHSVTEDVAKIIDKVKSLIKET
ncbi:MAG: Gfo/Idh/MocA family oxidoreductase [Bacteroidetes bacterium]|nr:Gfo/Idh/MocA family oxidoreductase [Bacteroidota bacterium]